MLSLLKIEWLKVKSYRTFWILFGVFFLLFPLTFYFSGAKFMENVSDSTDQANTIKTIVGAPFVFPKVWHSASWFGGMFFIILGMLFVLLITNEVHYRTHRQNIIDGLSRTEFILAKFSVMISLVLLSTVMVFLTGLFAGLVFSKSGSTASLFDQLYFVGYFALMATLYLTVAFLIAILVKRTGLAIIIYFAFVVFVDNLLWLALTFKDSQMGYFLPLESADSLVPNPFKPKMMERRKISDLSLIITASAYITAFTYAILEYFKRSDLKT